MIFGYAPRNLAADRANLAFQLAQPGLLCVLHDHVCVALHAALGESRLQETTVLMMKITVRGQQAVANEIDASQFRSLAQLLEESFRTYADRRAFICMDHAITYGELDQLSHAFAAWLQSRGLRPGIRPPKSKSATS